MQIVRAHVNGMGCPLLCICSRLGLRMPALRSLLGVCSIRLGCIHLTSELGLQEHTQSAQSTDTVAESPSFHCPAEPHQFPTMKNFCYVLARTPRVCFQIDGVEWLFACVNVCSKQETIYLISELGLQQHMYHT